MRLGGFAMKKLLAAALLAAAPLAASADGDAPFCVYTGSLVQCYYYSVDACRSAAASFNGMCAPNNQPAQAQQPMQQQPRVQPIQSPNLIGNIMQGYELGAQQRRAREEAEEHAARMELMQLQAQALRQQQESLSPPLYYLCPDPDDGSRYNRSEVDGLGCTPVR